MVTVQIAGYFGLMNWLPSIMQNRLGFRFLVFIMDGQYYFRHVFGDDDFWHDHG